MRRTATTALLTTCLLLLLPGTALAHASFDVRQLPASGTQDLVLRVPLERDAANDLVEVLVPGGFTVDACPAADGWSCEQATTTDGDTVVTLTRGRDGAGDTERFGLTVTAPAAEGTYGFPTIQTYGDGVEVAWIGESDTDQPAPRIQVGDETAPVEFSGDATPHTDLADDRTAVPSEPSDPTASAETDEAAPSAGASPTVTPTPSEDPVGSSADDAAAAPAEDEGEGDGPSAVLVVGLLVAALAVAGAAARYRSVTS